MSEDVELVKVDVALVSDEEASVNAPVPAIIDDVLAVNDPVPYVIVVGPTVYAPVNDPSFGSFAINISLLLGAVSPVRYTFPEVSFIIEYPILVGLKVEVNVRCH